MEHTDDNFDRTEFQFVSQASSDASASEMEIDDSASESESEVSVPKPCRACNISGKDEATCRLVLQHSDPNFDGTAFLLKADEDIASRSPVIDGKSALDDSKHFAQGETDKVGHSTVATSPSKPRGVDRLSQPMTRDTGSRVVTTRVVGHSSPVAREASKRQISKLLPVPEGDSHSVYSVGMLVEPSNDLPSIQELESLCMFKKHDSVAAKLPENAEIASPSKVEQADLEPTIKGSEKIACTKTRDGLAKGSQHATSIGVENKAEEDCAMTTEDCSTEPQLDPSQTDPGVVDESSILKPPTAIVAPLHPGTASVNGTDEKQKLSQPQEENCANIESYAVMEKKDPPLANDNPQPSDRSCGPINPSKPTNELPHANACDTVVAELAENPTMELDDITDALGKGESASIEGLNESETLSSRNRDFVRLELVSNVTRVENSDPTGARETSVRDDFGNSDIVGGNDNETSTSDHRTLAAATCDYDEIETNEATARARSRGAPEQSPMDATAFSEKGKPAEQGAALRADSTSNESTPGAFARLKRQASSTASGSGNESTSVELGATDLLSPEHPIRPEGKPERRQELPRAGEHDQIMTTTDRASYTPTVARIWTTDDEDSKPISDLVADARSHHLATDDEATPIADLVAKWKAQKKTTGSEQTPTSGRESKSCEWRGSQADSTTMANSVARSTTRHWTSADDESTTLAHDATKQWTSDAEESNNHVGTAEGKICSDLDLSINHGAGDIGAGPIANRENRTKIQRKTKDECFVAGSDQIETYRIAGGDKAAQPSVLRRAPEQRRSTPPAQRQIDGTTDIDTNQTSTFETAGKVDIRRSPTVLLEPVEPAFELDVDKGKTPIADRDGRARRHPIRAAIQRLNAPRDEKSSRVVNAIVGATTDMRQEETDRSSRSSARRSTSNKGPRPSLSPRATTRQPEVSATDVEKATIDGLASDATHERTNNSTNSTDLGVEATTAALQENRLWTTDEEDSTPISVLVAEAKAASSRPKQRKVAVDGELGAEILTRTPPTPTNRQWTTDDEDTIPIADLVTRARTSTPQAKQQLTSDEIRAKTMTTLLKNHHWNTDDEDSNPIGDLVAQARRSTPPAKQWRATDVCRKSGAEVRTTAAPHTANRKRTTEENDTNPKVNRTQRTPQARRQWTTDDEESTPISDLVARARTTPQARRRRATEQVRPRTYPRASRHLRDLSAGRGASGMVARARTVAPQAKATTPRASRHLRHLSAGRGASGMVARARTVAPQAKATTNRQWTTDDEHDSTPISKLVAKARARQWTTDDEDTMPIAFLVAKATTNPQWTTDDEHDSTPISKLVAKARARQWTTDDEDTMPIAGLVASVRNPRAQAIDEETMSIADLIAAIKRRRSV